MSQATLHTNYGPVKLELFDEDALKTVDNFLKLSRDGYYDGLIFHRVIKDFMIQGGCPEDRHRRAGLRVRGRDQPAQDRPRRPGDGQPRAGHQRQPVLHRHQGRGVWLDGKHTVFGRVVDGMDSVDSIENVETGPQDRPADPVVLEKVEVHEG